MVIKNDQFSTLYLYNESFLCIFLCIFFVTIFTIFQVLVPKDESLMGKLVHVNIVETTKFSMKGELIKEKPVLAPTVKVKKAPVMETTFQGSFFYTLSMIMLMIACLVRLYHIFLVKVDPGNNVKPSPSASSPPTMESFRE